jgi:hypothetical protein
MPPLGVFGRAAAAAAAAAAGPAWECVEPGAEEVDAILLYCVSPSPCFELFSSVVFSCCPDVSNRAAGGMGKRPEYR